MKSLLTICLIVIVAVIGVNVWQAESLKSHVAETRVLKNRLKAVQEAIDEYHYKFSSYPTELNSTFREKVRQKVDDSQDVEKWLKICNASTKQDALGSARLAGPREALYCPILDKGIGRGYYLLGKDESNRLLEVIDGPLVLSSELLP